MPDFKISMTMKDILIQMKSKMKMFKRLFISFSVILIAQGCTNLDEELLDKVTEDNFFTNEAEFASALGAPYAVLYRTMGNDEYFSLQEVSSDEMVIPQRGGDWFADGEWIRLHQHTSQPRDLVITRTWITLFEGVSATNRLIAQFETIENSEAVIAELKALRAFYYYMLIDTYGNVPLVKVFGQSEGQTPRNEIYDFIVADLEENVNLLSKEAGNATYGRMNFYAGQALLAKLYLNSGVYTGSGTPSPTAVDNVLKACDEIINSGNYDLENNYFDIFKVANRGSIEHIWVIPFDEVFAPGFNISVMTLHYGNQATFDMQVQPWNGYSTLQEFYNSYEDQDVRKDMNFLIGPQFASDGVTPILDPSFEPNDPDGPQVIFTPEINELEPNGLRQAGLRVNKFEHEIGGNENSNNDFPIFRYADILLMKAEALWRTGDAATALQYVDMVRERAGLESIGVVNEETLLAERGREMFCELYRRQDLLRFGKYNDGWEFNPPDPGDFVNLFPIPDAQLNADPTLVQNPGY